MVRIFANAHYDFIGLRRKAITATAVLFVIGMIALIGRGINYSVEFTGGTLMDITATKPIDVPALRADLEAVGLVGAEITPSAANQYLIRARTSVGNDQDNVNVTGKAIATALDKATGGHQEWRQNHRDAVGPKVGAELRTKAFMAIFLSFFAVLAYLAVRFEWRFGLAAVIATFHDIVLTICFIAVVRLEVSLVVVAAVLSMVGYSLNDTIVIFDRVRENMRKSRRENLSAVLNQSINETLPRSVLTHTTVLATLTALAIFGGPVIRPFALVMFFGVFTGTFSSVFIAAPVLLFIESKWPGLDPRTPRTSTRVSPAARRKPTTA